MGVGNERLSPGSRIGSYEIRRLLGQGASARVYECRHETLGRLAALKVLHSQLARDPIASARFLREGRALSRIIHPHVIEVFDVGTQDGVPYLVMSLVDGEDLAEHVRRRHPMSIAQICDCLLPVVSAVAAAHDAGVIHRDLKPSNVRLTRDHRGGLVSKVLDFGISKLENDDHGPDLTGDFGPLGTASYMAPEQLRSAKHVDERCDIYALGVILYECATGQRPFRGIRGYELMNAVLTATVPWPRGLRPEIPEAFEAIIMQAMQREVSARFSSARELGLALAPFATNEPTWQSEFCASFSKRSVSSPSNSRSAENCFTLVSGSNGVVIRRKAKAPLAVAVPLACLLAASAFAAIGRHAAPSRSSDDALVLAHIEQASPAVGPSNMVNGSASTSASPLAQSADQPIFSSPPAAPSLGRRPPRSAPMASSVVTPAPATSRVVRPTDEIGTNGAPIYE